MPTPAGHTRAIQASRVIGSTVMNAKGETLGSVEDVILDKTSDKIMFAVVSFGGFLGIGEKYHALPWAQLNYESDKDAYVVDVDRAQLEKAPNYDLNEFTRNDGLIGAEAERFYRM